jgi:hypothetical protein
VPKKSHSFFEIQIVEYIKHGVACLTRPDFLRGIVYGNAWVPHGNRKCLPIILDRVA